MSLTLGWAQNRGPSGRSVPVELMIRCELVARSDERVLEPEVESGCDRRYCFEA